MRATLLERAGENIEPFCTGARMETSVPRGEDEIVLGQHERGSQMQGVEAAELSIHRQRGRVLDQILIDLDDAERWPLLMESSGSSWTCRESDSTGGLHEADP